MAVVTATLSTITFNNDTADANGTKWFITEEIDGWDSPEVRQNVLTRSARHGTYMGESLYGQRSLIIRGVAKCTTEAGYYASRDLLAQITNLVLTSSTALVVTENGVAKQCVVRRAGRLRMAQVAANAFTFEIPLLSLDPRKYASTPQTAVAEGTATNNGNFHTWPTITLTNVTSSSVTVTNSTLGSSLVFTGLDTTLDDGLIINTDARTIARADGTNRFSTLTVASSVWWWLNAGANTWSATGAVATLTFSDAWI